MSYQHICMLITLQFVHETSEMATHRAPRYVYIHMIILIFSSSEGTYRLGNLTRQCK